MKSLLPPRSTIICFIRVDDRYNNGKCGVKRAVPRFKDLINFTLCSLTVMEEKSLLSHDNYLYVEYLYIQ